MCLKVVGVWILAMKRHNSSSEIYFLAFDGQLCLGTCEEASYLEVMSAWVCRMPAFISTVLCTDGLQFVDSSSL